MSALLLEPVATPQQIDLGSAGTPRNSRRQHVELISDLIAIVAGKPQDVDILFRVDPGFHINSHRPKDELLIPTALRLAPSPEVKVLSEQYPDGRPFTVTVGSESETLNVYSGEIRVGLRVIAPKGMTRMGGTLHYQACDNAACFPPRDLPIAITLDAK